MKFILTAAAGISLLSSCEAVKPYQKAYLNEEEMQLSMRKIESFEINFQSYREGGSGANGGKVGGGCGCN
ncbi:DUF4266 domain-containing protein [Pontibacter vulgaris]|uniref:DUF4266 domain-containing protein n=1 Tax=Pontibacter vulgaris TaxID=2905679 RepID=UPI00266C99B4|nr:DUF4266 domain-containing protein [Pontibacter vulgaris]